MASRTFWFRKSTTSFASCMIAASLLRATVFSSLMAEKMPPLLSFPPGIENWIYPLANPGFLCWIEVMSA